MCPALFSAVADGKKNSSVRLGHALSVSVVNSLWTILTGTKIPHGDSAVEEIVSGSGEKTDIDYMLLKK